MQVEEKQKIDELCQNISSGKGAWRKVRGLAVSKETQLKALIRNVAKAENIPANILLRNYMLEILLVKPLFTISEPTLF